MDSFMEEDKRRRNASIISILLAFVTGVIGLVVLFQFRDFLSNLKIILGINPWAFSAVDNFIILALGILWLITVYYSQYSYRRSAMKHAVIRTFAVATGIQLALLFISAFGNDMMGAINLNGAGWARTIGEGAVAVILFLFASWHRRRAESRNDIFHAEARGGR